MYLPGARPPRRPQFAATPLRTRMDCGWIVGNALGRLRSSSCTRRRPWVLPKKSNEERIMTTKSRLYLSVAAIALAGLLAASPVPLSAQQSAPPTVTVGATDVGGVVRSASGPEAGVWVIAETTDLPTKFARMVVTDDQGRYRHPRSAARELPGLGARLRAGGFAQGARASPASSSISPQCRRRTRPRPRTTTRRSTGTR